MYQKGLFLISLLFFLSQQMAFSQTPDKPTVPSVINYCDSSMLHRVAAPAQVTWYWQGTNANGTDQSDANLSKTVTTAGTYYLRAFHQSGNWSVESAEITVSITSKPAVPNAPASVANCGSTQLTKAAPPSGISYYWQLTANGKNATSYSANANFDVFANGNIFLRARRDASPNCWSDALTVASTVNLLPTWPAAKAATTITGVAFQANWVAVAGATSYFIDVATDRAFTNLITNNLNVGNVNAHTISGLSNNTEYFYRLRTTNGTCTSLNSNTISVTTRSCNPQPEIYIIVNDNILANGNTTPDFELNTKFGNVQINEVPAEKITKQYEIFNKGDANLVISAISLVGANVNPGEFTTNLVATTILPGNSQTFTITFEPDDLEAGNVQKEATLAITTNDPDNLTYQFKVGGYGVDNKNGPSILSGEFGAGGAIVDFPLEHRGVRKAVTVQPLTSGAALQFVYKQHDGVMKWRGVNTYDTRLFGQIYLDGAKWEGDRDLKSNLSSSNYYTFITDLKQNEDADMSILETTFQPTEILTVKKRHPFIYVGDVDTVDVTFSGALNAGENPFVRYTPDNWNTIFFVPVANFSGNSGYALIPAQPVGTTVIYYALTTPQAVPDNNDIDFFTLKINNNDRSSNYDYKVLPIPSASLSSDGEILEGAEDGEILTATISAGIFETPINPALFNLSNLPAGVTIGSITQGCQANMVLITLAGNATTDYDTPINNNTLTIASEAVYGIGVIKNGMSATGIEFTPKAESLAAATTTCLSDATLNYATVELTITNDRFLDADLDNSNFSINNAPAGLSVQDVIYSDATHATIYFTHDGSSLAANHNITFTINKIELAGNENLTTANTIPITNMPEPNLQNASQCGAGQITLTASNAGGNSIIFSADGNFIDATDATSPFEFQTPNLPEGANQTFYAATQNPSGCASEWVSATAVANVIPSEVILENDEFCGTATYDLSAIIGNQGETVDFSLDGSTVSASDNTSTYNFTSPSISAGTSLTIHARTRNTQSTCASGWQNAVITAHEIPTPTFTNEDNSLCLGTSGTYTTQAGMTNYQWTIPSGGTITSGGTATDNSVTILWNTAGAQTVSVNYEDGNACKNANGAVSNIDVNNLPTPTFTDEDSKLCLGTSGIYSTQSGMANYQWNIPSGGTITSGGTATDNSVTILWNTAGASTVSVNYEDGNACKNTNGAVSNIDVGDLSGVEISDDVTITEGETTVIEVTENADYTYSWSPDADLSDNAIFNPTASPTATTTYSVQINDSFNCTATKEVTVTVEKNDEETHEIIINTGLTPNGDGKNDTWIIENIIHFSNNKVEIYNRQGVIVYRREGYKNEWKGTYMTTEKKLPVGTYYYLLDLGDGSATQKGSLTILK